MCFESIMNKNVLIWTVILVGCIDEVLAEISCEITEVKSSTPSEHDLSDFYYDHDSSEVYEKLYSFAICEGGEVDADYKINIHTSEELKYIIFQNSKLTTVPVHIFASLQGVQEMYLNSSEVETIQPGAFTGLSNLNQIYLQDNNITKLSAGIFNSLSKLEILNAANNVLESVEEHTFLGVLNLMKLDLHSNNLSYILPNTFANLQKLEYVDLSQNYLLEITSNVFATNQLLYLNLSCNSIQNVTFSHLPSSLQFLNLSHNVIAEVSNLSNLLSLLQLDVSFNKITQIFFAVQNQTETSVTYKLIDLDISHNLIPNITLNSFNSLQDLIKLNMANNLISAISIGSLDYLQSLIFLNMSMNKIEEVDFGTFGNLERLNTLDISNNGLSNFQESTLHGTKNLTHLYLSDNLIKSIDAPYLKAHCGYLKTISLHNNPWNCLILGKLVKTFETYQVTVIRGPTTLAQHVNGIRCYTNNLTEPLEYISTAESTTKKFLLPNMPNVSTYFDSLAENINTTFNTFFNNFHQLEDTLRSSSVHAFPNFENLDARFKSTSFYKFFTIKFDQTDFFRHTSKYCANAEHEKVKIIPKRLESNPPSPSDSDKFVSRLDEILGTFKGKVTVFMILVLIVLVTVTVLLVLLYLKVRSIDKCMLLQKRKEESTWFDAQLELI
ncbi:toll-like receptor 6 [Photinus pyralis]|uniref:toll-like receptor 6 n=1 Tax=Photinus pyralis TaxID=7054 RepID=UPI0012674168|nr:toll-like receptor 6 [Photinus pyralis]